MLQVSLEESMEDTGWENVRNQTESQRGIATIKKPGTGDSPGYPKDQSQNTAISLILRIIMGVPSEKVSQLLKIPVATVNTHTHRALKELRVICGQEGLHEDEVFQ